MMKSVSAEVKQIVIPTYKEGEEVAEPVFAENRVHQRTSGNPYPNRVVADTDRHEKYEREYTCITLENDYIRVQILPELGGRIYSALDKTTGYDFFYKQHVIKPALIGLLGSWISGGVEFNWPLHHRPSTFKPVDYFIDKADDGTVTVWLSEHEPLNRMKGMTGIRLYPHRSIIETAVRLYNRTELRRSFLWWENTAVPVNENYRIFFPPDVSYVNFHYKRSVTTYPIASNSTGIYNGIDFGDGTDISMHKNSHRPTSYFSAPSRYDFFGGYDCGKECGVVHVSDHCISPGKKLFTWGYTELAKSWEKALTDDDGQYAELMAGCYSDNQPDFSWLEPYETKTFSQFWYPISKIGVPTFANINGAFRWHESGASIEVTSDVPNAKVAVKSGETVLFEITRDFTASVPACVELPAIAEGLTLTVTDSDGQILMDYTCSPRVPANIPPLTKDLPDASKLISAQDLYLEGLHVEQYRDPKAKADYYYKKALQRDPGHIPSLIAMGEWEYRRGRFDEAEDFTSRAICELTKFNRQPESGRAYYLMGLIYCRMHSYDKAYEYFRKAAWNYDFKSAALTKAAGIAGIWQDYKLMECLASDALRCSSDNNLACAYLQIARLKMGKTDEARQGLLELLRHDPLDQLVNFLYALNFGFTDDFYRNLKSDPSRTCIDIAEDLLNCGCKAEADALMAGVTNPSTMLKYMRGEKSDRITGAYPSLLCELEALLKTVEADPNDAQAQNMLGSILYHYHRYEEAARHFQAAVEVAPHDYLAYRNLAVAFYSHLEKREQAQELLQKAVSLDPTNRQLVHECAYVMAKNGVDPAKRISFILERTNSDIRWDTVLELARAYNQAGQYENALTLMLSHEFVPYEGGEHAVAEQYMFALHQMGRAALKENKPKEALELFRRAQMLPENLGSGIWNTAFLVPHQYYEALCLEKLGQPEQADTIYDRIIAQEADYFTDMHLPALTYYRALCYNKRGKIRKALAILDEAEQKYKQSICIEDPGFFSTTPFFISYVDDSSRMRKAH